MQMEDHLAASAFIRLQQSESLGAETILHGDRDLLQFIQPALGVGSLAIGFSRLAFGTLLCKSLACSLKSQPRI